MRRALLIGINDYPTSPLNGCINDAKRMHEVLAKHSNGDLNFDCKLLLSDQREVTRTELRSNIKQLFNQRDGDTALLYFSGHGATTEAGTYLVAQNGTPNDEGVSLMEIVALANNSKAKEVIMILDCCYAGDAGNSIDLGERKVLLREGVSILAAASDNQYSYEKHGKGIFTSMIYDAMKGSAADVLGRITIASLYYYADMQLGAWNQRPVFKSHVSRMISIRNCQQKIDNEILRKLPVYFSDNQVGFPLSVNLLQNNNLAPVMKHMRLYYANGLILPVETDSLDAEAAINGACKLTPLGMYYKKLAEENRL